MFDPTIFDNIKVVLEGEVYELDLNSLVAVIKRSDIVDLALMSRTFIIQFRLINAKRNAIAEIQLSASTEDLASEILEKDSLQKPGCKILVKFHIKIVEPNTACVRIAKQIRKIWNNRPNITQRLSYTFNEQEMEEKQFLDEVILSFGRKIDEDNIKDINELVEYTYLSLIELEKIDV